MQLISNSGPSDSVGRFELQPLIDAKCHIHIAIGSYARNCHNQNKIHRQRYTCRVCEVEVHVNEKTVLSIISFDKLAISS